MNIAVFLGLVVAWFIGFEIGKYVMMNKIKSAIQETTRQLEQTTKQLKEVKKNESTENR